MKKNFNFKEINFKPFIFAFLGVILMNILQGSGLVKQFRFYSPLSQTTIIQENFFDTVRPLLERYRDSYKLYKKTSLIPQTIASEGFDYDEASAYLVVDYDTGEILAEKESSAKLPIASLTKIMTAVVTLDLAVMDEYFTVTPYAARQVPSKIYAKTDERLQVGELLEATLLTSANDAAQVLSDGIDEKYGDEIFIKAMNAKADFLKLNDTNFENPQGFDSMEHYSSAHDLAILTHYALTYYPEIKEIVQKDFSYLPKNNDHELYKLPNWNGLLGVYPNISGVKIGRTGDAGSTSIVISERSGKKIMVVVLGAPGLYERDIWASQLLNLGFYETLNLPPIEISREVLQEKYDSWYTRLREE